MDPVTALRQAQAKLPILRPALGGIGMMLITVGGSWAVANFVRNYPHIVMILVGAACVVTAMVADNRGLLAQLPRELQRSLLESSFLDMFVDDSGTTNLMRRWARVLLLCVARSDNEVIALTKGMDPSFVESVFRGNLLHWMPSSVRRVLLPMRTVETSLETLPSAPVGLELAPKAKPKGVVTPAEIRMLVKEANDSRTQKLVEPEFASAVVGLVKASLTDAGRNAAKKSAQVSVVAAGVGGIAVCVAPSIKNKRLSLTNSPFTSSFVQRTSTGVVSGLAKFRDSRIAKRAVIIAAISACSIGTFAVLAALMRHCPCVAPAWWRARAKLRFVEEPEREDSPMSTRTAEVALE